MNEECKLHSKPCLFLCYEDSCHRFLCLYCINEHQKNCHYINNTYQDLIPLEDFPFFFEDRLKKLVEKTSKTFIHKKDLIINYFFNQLSEVTTYYLENLNKSIYHEPLEIIEISGNNYINDLHENFKSFMNNENRNKEDYIKLLKDSDTNNAIEQIKKQELNFAKQKYPDLNKAFEESEKTINDIELSVLDFKKKVFSESYAAEMNQMLNFIDKKNYSKQSLGNADKNKKFEESNLCEVDIQQILLNLKNSQEHKEIKTNEPEVKQENKLEFDQLLQNSTNEQVGTNEIIEKTIISNKQEEQCKTSQNREIILHEKQNISEDSKVDEKFHDDEKDINEIKQVEPSPIHEISDQNLQEDDQIELITKDDGCLIDYDLEEFEYELETLNPENPYLFLYPLPNASSEYFLEILDLACKRIFSEDFLVINKVQEVNLSSKTYSILSTSGKYKKIEQDENQIEVFLLNIELIDDQKHIILFDKKGLQLILPSSESEDNVLKYNEKNNENPEEKEKEICFSKDFLSLLKEKIAIKLDENLKIRNPLHFYFRRYVIQLNETYDKIRIIDKFAGFRSFTRSCDKGLGVQDLDMEMIFDYIYSNNLQILHLEELDIFLNISHHNNFIIFNRRFQDMMVLNFITPEFIMNHIDLYITESKKHEIALEIILKNLLFNSDIKIKKMIEVYIFSKNLEVLTETGEIKNFKNLENYGGLCCNFTMRNQDNLTKRHIYVVKSTNQVIVAFDPNTMVRYPSETNFKPIEPYEKDLNTMLRISQYFLKTNLENFYQCLFKLGNNLLIYVVNDNSSFYVKNLKDNSDRIHLFFQQFQPDQRKYYDLTQEFFNLLQNLSEFIIYKETNNIQFIYKEKSNEILVRWNGNNLNLFSLENKKHEIARSSKPVYRKKDREKRPEKKYNNSLISENEI